MGKIEVRSDARIDITMKKVTIWMNDTLFEVMKKYSEHSGIRFDILVNSVLADFWNVEYSAKSGTVKCLSKFDDNGSCRLMLDAVGNFHKVDELLHDLALKHGYHDPVTDEDGMVDVSFEQADSLRLTGDIHGWKVD